MYMYQEDLALSKLQWLIYYTTKPTQSIPRQCMCAVFLLVKFIT